MRSFQVKLGGREQGPYTEAQIAQMFADGSIDRHTPCKVAGGGEWKTIDDYLPMLKYGTQLPPPTAVAAVHPGHSSTAPASTQRVAIVDLDIPFLSLLKMMFKWAAPAFVVVCCFMPVIIVIWIIIAAVFAAAIRSAVSHGHHP